MACAERLKEGWTATAMRDADDMNDMGGMYGDEGRKKKRKGGKDKKRRRRGFSKPNKRRRRDKWAGDSFQWRM